MKEKALISRQELLDMLTEEFYETAFVVFLTDEQISAKIIGTPNNISKIFASIFIQDPDWITSMGQGIYNATIHLINILGTGNDEEAKIAEEKLTKIITLFREITGALSNLLTQTITELKKENPNENSKS